jgi:hypothetical protein
MRVRRSLIAVNLAAGAVLAGVLAYPTYRSATAPETPACELSPVIALKRLPASEPFTRRVDPTSPVIFEETVHPGATAHKGLSLLASGDRGSAVAMLELLKSAAVEVDGFTLLPYRFDFTTGPIVMSAPWYSAMDQGQALSLAVRLGDITFARQLLPALTGPSPVTRAVPAGLSLEEYPSDPPNPVLNGAVFATYGLYDWWVATGEDEGALRAALTAIRLDLVAYRRPGAMPWYDFAHGIVIPSSYVSVYDEQMTALAAMTGDPCFAEMRVAFAYDTGTQ